MSQLDKGGELPPTPPPMVRTEQTQEPVSYSQWASPEYQQRWRDILKAQDKTVQIHVTIIPEDESGVYG